MTQLPIIIMYTVVFRLTSCAYKLIKYKTKSRFTLIFVKYRKLANSPLGEERPRVISLGEKIYYLYTSLIKKTLFSQCIAGRTLLLLWSNNRGSKILQSEILIKFAKGILHRAKRGVGVYRQTANGPVH